MDNEEIQGVKFSEFPSATPGNSDEVVGLHSGDNARFSIANIVAAVRNGLANIFVPKTDVGAAGGVAELDSTGKVPSAQLPPIAFTAADVTYDNTGSGLSATDVQDAIDELAQGGGGGGGTAASVSYDHTTSGLTATNVQDAIDEVVTDLDGKQSTIIASGILIGNGAGGVSAATPGQDYQAPLTAGTDYATPAQLEGKANQSQLAYVENGTTASRNYTAGQYISLNGLLYTADTEIASGATFYTSGGNKNLTECAGGGFNDRSTGTVGRGTMTSGTILSASLVRWSRVIVCTCQLYGLSGINRSDCVPFRMPEGFRPTSDTNIQLVFNDGNNGKQWSAYGTLKSDGYVSANNAVLGSFAPLVTAIQIQSAVWLI